jgi:hypothetical protein
LWRKIEHPEVVPVRLRPGDECYYAREYVSHGNWDASEANQLIRNFKKTNDRRGRPEWRYKTQAIHQFATELAQIVNYGILCAIPSSKRRDDPLYDSRLDDVLSKLRKMNPEVTVERPFEVMESHEAAHAGGARSEESFYGMMEWKGFQQAPEDVVLIDDVITTGAHFKACQRMIREYHPAAKVYGIFWAKVIWPDPEQAPNHPFLNLDL